MMREMLQAKLHRAVVTETHLDYAGSLTVDEDLIDRAGMRVGQKVQVVNINNGARLETYLIPGTRGSRELVVNGAAARLAQPGDQVIVIAYAIYDEAELATYEPVVLRMDDCNRVLARIPHGGS